MGDYEVKLEWREGKIARMEARQNPAVLVAPPPEFGGPEGYWSPEELLVGALGSCLLSTLLYFTERGGVELAAYTVTARGAMAKTAQGLRFTTMDVTLTVTLKDPAQAPKVEALRDKLEQYCPVSQSLKVPVRVELWVDAAV